MKPKFNNAVGPQNQHTSSKLNIVLMFFLLTIIVAGLQVATQYFAAIFQYQPELGASFYHLYAPWSIIVWALKWTQFQKQIVMAGSVGLVVTAIGFIAIAIIKMVKANSPTSNAFLHGSARWANRNDIETAGLLPKPRSLFASIIGKPKAKNTGVYVGAWLDKKGQQHYLKHNGAEHVLCYAPTRSGKGVGLVVPTLLSWTESSVITDLKGELWALTSGWRQQYAKNKVIRFEPTATSGCIRWNPLDEIRLETEYEVGDVQNLATLIVDPDGRGLESHWQKTSQALLVGVILHALYKAKYGRNQPAATLPRIDMMLSDPERDIRKLWDEMITFSHTNGQNHPVVGSAARDMKDRPEEEAGSVLSTAKSYLSLYRDPVVAKNISASEFKIKDLMNYASPVSLYIITTANDKARLRPLVRVLVNMIVRLLADKVEFVDGQPKAHYKHRLLLMLDEFPSLGRLEIFQESLAFIAGYGIKAYLICQDINQLKSRETGYGNDETITSNCHVQTAFPPNRIETADHLSKLTGQTTVIKEQITTSGHRTSALMGNVSRTMQEVQRPLLTPDECMRMPGPQKNGEGLIDKPGDMVIYVAGYPAVYGVQPLYFKDRVFKARAALAAPKKSDQTRTVKSDETNAISV